MPAKRASIAVATDVSYSWAAKRSIIYRRAAKRPPSRYGGLDDSYIKNTKENYVLETPTIFFSRCAGWHNPEACPRDTFAPGPGSRGLDASMVILE